MMYNPNNVALESSPYTTSIERQVGLDLCQMMGYNIRRGIERPVGWGHITCDGSVANLEAIWAARNLKFYPLSLRRAMRSGNALEFLRAARPVFQVQVSEGVSKDFLNLTSWELMNLAPSVILNLPTRLQKEYGVSPSFLESSLQQHLVQTTGMKLLEDEFGITKPAKFFVSATRHYSWPKGGAITGMGSDRFVDVKVDKHARMDITALKEELDESFGNETPVFGVIVIMGSTEHGACDPLSAVISLRDTYEREGKSFAVHCDAAWGGYFTSMLGRPAGYAPFVPTLALKPYTVTQLQSLQYANTITVDPHKSGYINYPAGGLCYQDERMRFLITWTSPIVFHQGDQLESMGVYGVEGSKPGAAAVAAWLSHETIKLTPDGYGRLLGEAIFTATKLYCHWATMTLDEQGRDNSDLIVVPLNMLPAETENNREKPWTSDDVLGQRRYIQENILRKSNKEVSENATASDLLKKIGSDLMINAFACNFKIHGVANKDVNEANYLNSRIFKRLSITSLNDQVEEKPMFLTESRFTESAYGDCLRKYKKRLGLGSDAVGDLVSLINVTMSPWPSDSTAMTNMVNGFKRIAGEEVQRCLKRNMPSPDIHGFVMQGTQKLFLVHLPMFHMANHRRQFIIEAEIPEEVMSRYTELRTAKPNQFFTLANVEKEHLKDLVNAGSFQARMDEGIPKPQRPIDNPEGEPVMPDPLETGFQVTIKRVVVSESLCFDSLSSAYPKKMPFYLYGDGSEYHIDHVLMKSPNAQLSADCVQVATAQNYSPLSACQDALRSGILIEFDTVPEHALQPLSTNNSHNIANSPGLGFIPEAQFKFTAYTDRSASEVLTRGTLKLGSNVYADWHELNMDPADH
ncbi:uncharacterized protein LDX57_004590 [Aspergillus melleus]|uniref:uncharacterized protein n=1 Tax=Aspergillus melleus TaxID=138277 RepID=UPI001E8E522E|nr:uncharacterized protein LDX57_004590 [Aspergillus melleus]KAH8426863.1 hypothetical protein LDX57_004590 [Aspergillus melleus]